MFRVRDSGIGISPELLPSVFDLFVQGSNTLERSQGGLGIGLTIVKGIVAMHGGTVTAHSEGPGRGSEFAIRLPRAIGVSASAAGATDASALSVADCGSLSSTITTTSPYRLSFSSRRSVARLWSSTTVPLRSPPRPHSVPSWHCSISVCPSWTATSSRAACATSTGPFVSSRSRATDKTRDRARSKEAGFDEHLVKPIEIASLRRVLETARDATAR